jgi:hypothetical protein
MGPLDCLAILDCQIAVVNLLRNLWRIIANYVGVALHHENQTVHSQFIILLVHLQNRLARTEHKGSSNELVYHTQWT